METAGSAPAFHQHFKQRVSDVQSQIDTLSRPDLSPEGRKAVTETILASITRLSATLADASNDLASYDQRSYNQTVKTLQDQLAASQAILAPKTKFSFKSKKSNGGANSAVLMKAGQRSHLLATSSGPASDVDSTATSRSATPSHLQDPDDIDLWTRQPVPSMAPPPTYFRSTDATQSTAERTTGEPLQPTEIHEEEEEEEMGLTITSMDNTYVSLRKMSQRKAARAAQGSQTSEWGHSDFQLCTVSRISHSFVYLDPGPSETSQELSSLTLTNSDSILLMAPEVKGPMHITSVCNSILVLFCRQFRMHDSHNTTVYLNCTSRPIIEDCTGIRFAAMPSMFARGNVPPTKNMFDQVDDFKWLRAEASPNWSLLQEDQHVETSTWENVLQSVQRLDSDPDIESSNVSAKVGSILQALHIGVR